MVTLNVLKSKLKFLSKILGIPLVIIILISIGIQVKEFISPAPPPPPTVEFGKLPPISFPLAFTDKKLEFSLDTISGALPNFPDRVKVYKVLINKPDFFSLDKAKDRVSKAGFISKEEPVSEDIYRWTTQDYLSRKMVMNIFTFNFKLSSSFLSDPTHKFSMNTLDEKTAIDVASLFLQKINFFPEDIDTTKTKTSLFVLKNYTLLPASSISTANIIRVDFFQKDIDNLPIFYPRAQTSTMNLFIGEVQNNLLEILEANFSHKNISNISSTYPLKTSNEALLELKQGKAYIASYSGENSDIVIKNVYLAYYLGEDDQNYLMPIIVFEGEDGFFGYIPGIRDEWVGK